MTEFELEDYLEPDWKDNLFLNSCNRRALQYLTEDERDVIKKLGEVAYVKQQEEGRKKRNRNIQQLEAQIGKLNFQPLNIDTFGVNDVLRKYGCIFELRYPNSLLYGYEDTNFYACLMREDKPFCKKEGLKFQDYRGKLYHGLLQFTHRCGSNEYKWYIEDEGMRQFDDRWAFDDNANPYHTRKRYFFQRIALLSKRHWKILKKYID